MPKYLANDKFSAVSRATYIASPADTTIQVTAIPPNLPTIVVLGWNTQYETVFTMTGTSGTNSSNYALTGVLRIKGYTGNIPEGVAVNCLNNEEFLNQYSGAMDTDDVQTVTNKDISSATNTFPSSLATDAGVETFTNKRITKRAPTVTQSATPTINTDVTDVAHIVGLAQAITSFTTNLTGTPVQGDTLRINITDDGTGRALTFGASFEASGNVALPTTTIAGVRLDIGFLWNTVTSKWRCVAVA